MKDMKGLLFMAALIIFILISSPVFRGNPLEDDDCQGYAFNNADC